MRRLFFHITVVGVALLNMNIAAGVQSVSAAATNQSLDQVLEKTVYAPIAGDNLFKKIITLENRIKTLTSNINNPKTSQSARTSQTYLSAKLNAKIADLRSRLPYASQDAFKKAVENKLINDYAFKKDLVAAVEKYYNGQLFNGKYEEFYGSLFLKDNYRTFGVTNAKEFFDAMAVLKPRMKVSLLPTSISINKPLDSDYSMNDALYGVSLKVTNYTSCKYHDGRLDKAYDCSGLKIVYGMDGNFYTNNESFPLRMAVIKNQKGSSAQNVLMTKNINNLVGIMSDVTQTKDKIGQCFTNNAYVDCGEITVRITDATTGKTVRVIDSTRQNYKSNNMISFDAPGLISGKQYILSISPPKDEKHPLFFAEFKY